MAMTRRLDFVWLALGLLVALVGSYMGLIMAPTDAMQGDVYRIMFIHVPSAWVSMIAYVATFVASVVYLLSSRPGADAFAEASAEVGALFNAILLVTGSIWGKPTWGVWWSWDPRLTTAAIMLFAYLGYLALRRFVDIPEKRATWSAVVAIIVSVDIPIVWFSVKWWNTLHQVQSSKQTMNPVMWNTLWVNVLAFVLLYIFLALQRYDVARSRARFESNEPPPALALGTKSEAAS